MKKIPSVLLILLSLLLLLPPQINGMAQSQQVQVRITQVDTSQFPRVTVYISATDPNGQPVGVDPNQIQILENGTVIQAEEVSGSGELGPLTVLLVMDVSGSMNNGHKLDGAKSAAKAFIDQMRPGDQAGLLTFNTRVDYVQTVTSDHAVLIQAVQGLQAENDTAMYDALVDAAGNMQEFSGRKALLVLTDGMDNRSTHTPEDVINAISPEGLTISIIGLGDVTQPGSLYYLDEDALRSLSSLAGGVYSFASNPDSLKSIYEQYSRVLQSEYTFTYTSPSSLRDGIRRSLTVRLASGSQVEASYNPGGVLPELPQKSTWLIFLASLGGLLVLLFIPGLISLVASGIKGGSARRRKPRIKLH